jgi:hypothetical protein
MALDELPFPIFYFSIRQLDEIRINDGRRSPNTKGVVKDEDTNHGSASLTFDDKDQIQFAPRHF